MVGALIKFTKKPEDLESVMAGLHASKQEQNGKQVYEGKHLDGIKIEFSAPAENSSSPCFLAVYTTGENKKTEDRIREIVKVLSDYYKNSFELEWM